MVEASDGAEVPRRSILTLSVTVLDVDDNSPVFSQQSYDVNLPENTPKDTVILQLKVGVWEDRTVQRCIFVTVQAVNYYCSICLEICSVLMFASSCFLKSLNICR